MSSGFHVQSRPLYILCLSFFVMLLSACGSSPESTVEDYFDAVADNRIDEAISYFSLKDVGKNDLTTAKGKLQMIVGEQHSRIMKRGGIKSLKATTIEETEDSATVEVETVFNDGTNDKDRIRLQKEDGAWKIHIK
jgi:hypothetical protein